MALYFRERRVPIRARALHIVNDLFGTIEKLNKLEQEYNSIMIDIRACYDVAMKYNIDIDEIRTEIKIASQNFLHARINLELRQARMQISQLYTLRKELTELVNS